jgi:hypothetical protein
MRMIRIFLYVCGLLFSGLMLYLQQSVGDPRMEKLGLASTFWSVLIVGLLVLLILDVMRRRVPRR